MTMQSVKSWFSQCSAAARVVAAKLAEREERHRRAGQSRYLVEPNVKDGKGDYGYNARTGKYENFFESGVIDPAKVERVALENAASIAGLFLTTECVLVDKPEPAPAAPAAAPGMGGMM